MSEPNRPSSRALGNHFAAALKTSARASYNTPYRLFLSAIVRFHAYCAVAMTALCVMGVIIGKAPAGNAAGAAIFALAAALLLRLAKFIRPTETSN